MNEYVIKAVVCLALGPRFFPISPQATWEETGTVPRISIAPLRPFAIFRHSARRAVTVRAEEEKKSGLFGTISFKKSASKTDGEVSPISHPARSICNFSSAYVEP